MGVRGGWGRGFECGGAFGASLAMSMLGASYVTGNVGVHRATLRPVMPTVEGVVLVMGAPRATSPVRALWVLGWALLAVSTVSPVAERASVTLVLLMVMVLRVVPWVAESPAVPMVMVLPVASILRLLLPVVVGLVCATGGVTVQVVVRPGAPS